MVFGLRVCSTRLYFICSSSSAKWCSIKSSKQGLSITAWQLFFFYFARSSKFDAFWTYIIWCIICCFIWWFINTIDDVQRFLWSKKATQRVCESRYISSQSIFWCLLEVQFPKATGMSSTLPSGSRTNQYIWCHPDTPCGACPKGHKSNWELVGCQRHDFTCSLELCPFAGDGNYLNLAFDYSLWSESPEFFSAEPINYNHGIRCQNRASWIIRLLDISTSERMQAQEQDLTTRDKAGIAITEMCIQIGSRMSSAPPVAASQPLKECLLSILWETTGNGDDYNQIFDSYILYMIPSAIVYQAIH